MKTKTAFIALSLIIAALIAYNILIAPKEPQLKIPTTPLEIIPVQKETQAPPKLKIPSCLPQLTESKPTEKPIESQKTKLKKNKPQQYDGEFQDMLSNDMLSLVTNIGSNSFNKLRNSSETSALFKTKKFSRHPLSSSRYLSR